MKNYILEEKLGNEILAYLQKRPYEEVAVLISKMIALKPVKEDKEDAKPKTI